MLRPFLMALPATRCLPAGVRGPVACSHGLRALAFAACAARLFCGHGLDLARIFGLLSLIVFFIGGPQGNGIERLAALFLGAEGHFDLRHFHVAVEFIVQQVFFHGDAAVEELDEQRIEQCRLRVQHLRGRLLGIQTSGQRAGGGDVGWWFGGFGRGFGRVGHLGIIGLNAYIRQVF